MCANLAYPVPLCRFRAAYVEGVLHCYALIARRQPIIVDASGQPFALPSEVGPGSIVRVSLFQQTTALVMREVSVIEHRAIDLFHVG